jgi:chemotaxis signal transduction protein
MEEQLLFTAPGAGSLYSRQPLEQLSDKEFWDLAAASARLNVITGASSDEYLVCGLGQGRCLVPLASLCEVMSPPHRFSLFPATPAWMIGVGRWRGKIIAAIDLAAYLLQHRALCPHVYSDGMLLVAEQNELTLGLFVSTIEATIHADAGQARPFTQASEESKLIRANVITKVMTVEEEDLPVLDMGLAFNDMVESIKNDSVS